MPARSCRRPIASSEAQKRRPRTRPSRKRAASEVLVLGPAEAPIAVIRGRHRFRILVKASRGADLQAFLRAMIAEAPQAARRRRGSSSTSTRRAFCEAAEMAKNASSTIRLVASAWSPSLDGCRRRLPPRRPMRACPSASARLCEGLIIRVTDFPDEETLDAMGCETDFDLLGLFTGVGLAQQGGRGADRPHAERHPPLPPPASRLLGLA